MKLVRNLTTDKRGKYAVVRMQKLPDDPGRRADCDHAFRLLEHNGMLEWGEPGSEHEFFVLMLKDVNAKGALYEYANMASAHDDNELAADVRELAGRAGLDHPRCKKPD